MDDEFSLTLEVTEYVEIEQPEVVEGPAPAELTEITPPEEFTFDPVVEIVPDEWQLGPEYYVDAKSIVPAQPDYLLRDSSTWTEEEYSIQLFGEPGHTWAEMGFA